MEIFLANLPRKYSLLAELMYFSAGRVQEIASLKVRNINQKDALLTIEKSSTKTKQTRQIPMPPMLLKNLVSWIEENSLEDDYIFFTESRNSKCKKGEKAITTRAVDQFFRKAFDWNGIDGASTHSFRRTRLTELHVQEGWSLREIMDISSTQALFLYSNTLIQTRKIRLTSTENYSRERMLDKVSISE